MISITKDQLTLNQIEETYRKYFQNIDDYWGYAKSMGKLSMFVFATHNKNRYRYLDDFAKEYYEMKNQTITFRNNLIDKVKSQDYKKEKWFDKIVAKINLNRANKYCQLFSKFEDTFYNKLGVSLLKIENERLAKEQREKRTQLIQQ